MWGVYENLLTTQLTDADARGRLEAARFIADATAPWGWRMSMLDTAAAYVSEDDLAPLRQWLAAQEPSIDELCEGLFDESHIQMVILSKLGQLAALGDAGLAVLADALPGAPLEHRLRIAKAMRWAPASDLTARLFERLIRDTEKSVRIDTLQALGTAKHHGLVREALLEAAQADDASTRGLAVMAMSTSDPDEDFAAVLREHLSGQRWPKRPQEDRWRSRVEAAVTLLSWGDTRSTASAIEYLGKQLETRSRSGATLHWMVMLEVSPAELVDMLPGFLIGGSRDDRANAASALHLARRCPDDAVPRLLVMLRSRDPTQSGTAAAALGWSVAGGQEVTDALVHALADNPSAIEALVQREDRSVWYPLAEALEHHSCWRVRRSVAAALGR